ncbi:MAG: T9SS type A sorting domain-containing protein [Saprospiraceae bacterium]
MKKKVTYFLWLAFCLVQSLSAQKGIVSSGGDHFSQDGSIAYSVGQVAYATIHGETGNVNPGLQQPFHFSIVGVVDFHSDYLFHLYPNPANQFLCLQISTGESFTSDQDFIAKVYDVKGNLLINQRLLDNINTILIRDLPEAPYFVQIWQSKKFVQSISFTKNN